MPDAAPPAPPRAEPAVMPLARRVKAILAQAYGERFAGLVLFGSQARGEATAGSDIDLMLLLHGDVDRWAEIDRTVDLVYDLEAEVGEVISIRSRSLSDYRTGKGWFLRNVREDAVEV